MPVIFWKSLKRAKQKLIPPLPIQYLQLSIHYGTLIGKEYGSSLTREDMLVILARDVGGDNILGPEEDYMKSKQ